MKKNSAEPLATTTPKGLIALQRNRHPGRPRIARFVVKVAAWAEEVVRQCKANEATADADEVFFAKTALVEIKNLRRSIRVAAATPFEKRKATVHAYRIAEAMARICAAYTGEFFVEGEALWKNKIGRRNGEDKGIATLNDDKRLPFDMEFEIGERMRKARHGRKARLKAELVKSVREHIGIDVSERTIQRIADHYRKEFCATA